MKTKEICYWCGKPATSREHVPPKCLFPENKDIQKIYDESFRNNLITVPSCDKHNLQKSHDDEYLMTCLSGRIGNNGVSYIHTLTKVARSVERNPKIIKTIGDDVLTIAGKEFPVSWVVTDNNRLIYSFESIARALYFHENKEIFIGKCIIVSDLFIQLEDDKNSKSIIKDCKLIEAEKSSWKTKVVGENPRIFTYQFSNEDAFGCLSLILTFYEKTKVYVVLAKDNSPNREKHQTELLHLSKIFFEID